MRRILLDYPWPLEAGLGPDPVPQEAILEFTRLVRRNKLQAVPFIDQTECDLFWVWAAERPGLNRYLPAIRLFIQLCSKAAGVACQAIPNPGPADLRDSWKRALREELRDVADWRTPQIAISRARKDQWPAGDEVEITCDACQGEPASGPHGRILVIVDDYDNHRFAMTDGDPWRHLLYLEPPTVNPRITHPCILPRPPMLEGVPLREIPRLLKDVAKSGWNIGEHYYFVPPNNYDPEAIEKDRWRNGHGFKRETIQGWNGPCLKDYKDQLWRWDRGERHWDVETKTGRLRVSHDGRPV